MATEKKDVWYLVKIITVTAGLVGILTGAIAFFIDYGAKNQEGIQYREIQKEVSFDNSEQKHDVIDLLDIDYHPLTIAKTQDTLSEQLQRVDTLLSQTLIQKKKEAEYKRKKDIEDSINTIKVQKSREERNKIQANILDQLQLIKLDIRGINKKLDTLK